jgi:hypothetical protein
MSSNSYSLFDLIVSNARVDFDTVAINLTASTQEIVVNCGIAFVMPSINAR